MKKLLILLLLNFILNGNAADYSNIVIKIIDTYVTEILDSGSNASECTNQLRLYVDGIKASNSWALEMLDSTAKLQSGTLTGNLVQIGQYDECLEIDEISNGSHIQGQYCRSTVTPTDTVNECIDRNFNEKGILGVGDTSMSELKNYLKIYWDICVPAVCSAKEIQNIWNYAENHYELKFHLMFRDDLCSTTEKLNYYSQLHIAAIATFAIIGVIVLMSTLYDIFVFQKREDKKYNIFMAFSYYTNAKRIFAIKRNDDTKITCLHGIRVISMMWIILGHRYLTSFQVFALNYTYWAEWLKHEENMFIIGALSSVDTFFVISGFLIVYIIMLANANGIKVNLITFYIHRILRLTPSLAAIILAQVGILPHLGSGPYWNYVELSVVQPCMEYWWSTLTFIQNYLHPTDSCVGQAWYLSVDTQLYVLSPLIFLPLQRWPKPTIAFVVGLIVVSIGFAVNVTYEYEMNNISIRVIREYFENVYQPTHIRMGPWLIGILLGYFLFVTRNTKIAIKKKYVYLFWALCLTVMLLVLYASIVLFNIKFTILEAALYNSVLRLIWAACICWIIFACSRGHGGYINKFLSLPVFNILARLTFAMYLTHLLVMTSVQGERRTTPYLHNMFHFYEVWGDFAFTVALSFIWTLTFESPVTILESVLIKRALNKNMNPNEMKIFTKGL